MDKNTLTELESENLDMEDMMVSDYYARQEVPFVDAGQELEAFHRRHGMDRRSTVRAAVVALISAAAVVLLLFTLWRAATPRAAVSPSAVSSSKVLVAYTAIPNCSKSVVLNDANGTSHVVGQKRITIAPVSGDATPKMHSLSTSAGRTAEVELPDGTIVWLNANSQLTFPDRFVGADRRVSVKGEAYFKVAHDKKHPFIVSTGKMETKVLGTEFDVNTNYGNSQCVTLVKGSVEVSAVDGNASRRICPGENAMLSPDASFAVKAVDTKTFCAWKDGNFYFDNATLWDIAQELGRWYNVSVVFNNPKLVYTRVFLSASRYASIDEMLDIVNALNKAKFTFKSGQIIIN